MKAYFDAMRRYFHLRGRSTRSQFWLFTLVLVILAFVAMVIDGTVGNSAATAPGPVFLIVYFAHLIPALTLTVRRLHDVDRSGWWVLLGLVPLIGQLVLLVWVCTGSTTGANRFGPSSLGDAGTLAQQPPTSPQIANTGPDLDRLEKLAALKASGAIDDGEFQRLKAEVMTSTKAGQQ